ncbi:17853_t:CDS:2, partial [Dentiscutata erythropus]
MDSSRTSGETTEQLPTEDNAETRPTKKSKTVKPVETDTQPVNFTSTTQLHRGLKVANKTLAIFKLVHPLLVPEYIVPQINKELKILSDLTGIPISPVTNTHFISSQYTNTLQSLKQIQPKMIKEAVKAYFKNWTKLNKSDPQEWPSWENYYKSKICITSRIYNELLEPITIPKMQQ